MEELKKYMKPGISMIVIGVIFLAIAIIAAIAIFSWPVLIFVAFGGILLFVGISEQKKFNDYMQQITDSGEINQIVADFTGGRRMIKDNLVLGGTYAIGRKQGRAIPYTEMVQVYQHITKKNFVESSRKLVYVDAEKKVHDLVDLPLRDKAKDEVVQIMVIIRAANPNVKLGYQ